MSHLIRTKDEFSHYNVSFNICYIVSQKCPKTGEYIDKEVSEERDEEIQDHVTDYLVKTEAIDGFVRLDNKPVTWLENMIREMMIHYKERHSELKGDICSWYMPLIGYINFNSKHVSFNICEKDVFSVDEITGSILSPGYKNVSQNPPGKTPWMFDMPGSNERILLGVRFNKVVPVYHKRYYI